MGNTEQQLTDFKALVRLLLRKYTDLRRDLNKVEERLAIQEKKAKDMEVLAQATLKDYETLKTIKMLEVSDGDLEIARKRVSKMIRDVDRCITMLTEQQEISK